METEHLNHDCSTLSNLAINPDLTNDLLLDSEIRNNTRTILESVCQDFENLDVLAARQSRLALLKKWKSPENFSEYSADGSDISRLIVERKVECAPAEDMFVSDTGSSPPDSYQNALIHENSISSRATTLLEVSSSDSHNQTSDNIENSAKDMRTDMLPVQNPSKVGILSDNLANEKNISSSLAELADAEIVQTSENAVSIIISNPRFIQVLNCQDSGVPSDTSNVTLNSNCIASEKENLNEVIVDGSTPVSDYNLHEDNTEKDPHTEVANEIIYSEGEEIYNFAHPYTALNAYSREKNKPYYRSRADLGKVAATRTRRITAKMKAEWTRVLEEKGFLVCPLSGCFQKYRTMANFQTHYKYCYSGMEKDLKHCPYCASVIFSSHKAVLHHMKVEHPEKLDEYKTNFPQPEEVYNCFEDDESRLVEISQKSLKTHKRKFNTAKENRPSPKKRILKNKIKMISQPNIEKSPIRECGRFDEIVSKISSVNKRQSVERDENKLTKERRKRKLILTGHVVTAEKYFEDERDDDAPNDMPVEKETEEKEKIYTKSRLVLNMDRYKRYTQYLTVTRDFGSHRKTYSRPKSSHVLDSSQLLTIQNDSSELDIHQLNNSFGTSNISLNENDTLCLANNDNNSDLCCVSPKISTFDPLQSEAVILNKIHLVSKMKRNSIVNCETERDSNCLNNNESNEPVKEKITCYKPQIRCTSSRIEPVSPRKPSLKISPIITYGKIPDSITALKSNRPPTVDFDSLVKNSVCNKRLIAPGNRHLLRDSSLCIAKYNKEDGIKHPNYNASSLTPIKRKRGRPRKDSILGERQLLCNNLKNNKLSGNLHTYSNLRTLEKSGNLKKVKEDKTSSEKNRKIAPNSKVTMNKLSSKMHSKLLQKRRIKISAKSSLKKAIMCGVKRNKRGNILKRGKKRGRPPRVCIKSLFKNSKLEDKQEDREYMHINSLKNSNTDHNYFASLIKICVNQERSLSNSVNVRNEQLNETQDLVVRKEKIFSISHLSSKEVEFSEVLPQEVIISSTVAEKEVILPLSTPPQFVENISTTQSEKSSVSSLIVREQNIAHSSIKASEQSGIPLQLETADFSVSCRPPTNDKNVSLEKDNPPVVIKRSRGRPRKSATPQQGEKIDLDLLKGPEKSLVNQISSSFPGVRKSERVRKRKLGSDEIEYRSTEKIQKNKEYSEQFEKTGRRGRPRKYSRIERNEKSNSDPRTNLLKKLPNASPLPLNDKRTGVSDTPCNTVRGRRGRPRRERLEQDVCEITKSEPELSEITRSEPEGGEITRSEPEGGEIDTSEREVGEIDTSEREVGENDRSEREVGENDRSEREVGEVNISEPEVTEANRSESEVTEANRSEQEVSEITRSKLEIGEITRSEPEISKGIISDREIIKTTILEPENKSTISEPEVRKTVVSEPEINKSPTSEQEISIYEKESFANTLADKNIENKDKKKQPIKKSENEKDIHILSIHTDSCPPYEKRLILPLKKRKKIEEKIHNIFTPKSSIYDISVEKEMAVEKKILPDKGKKDALSKMLEKKISAPLYTSPVQEESDLSDKDAELDKFNVPCREMECTDGEIYPTLKPNISEFKINKLMWKEYLEASVSIKMNNTCEWIRLKCFDSISLDDSKSSTFFTGGPVQSSAFCPIPSHMDQYVAVASSNIIYSSGRQNSFSYLDTKCEKGLIQFWNLGCLQSTRLNRLPCMEFALEHQHGIITEMKWCPKGYDLPLSSDGVVGSRLGLLALTCSDSYIRVYCIPHPNIFPKINGNASIYTTSPALVLTPLFSDPCSLTRRSIATCLDWHQNADVIAAGYGNGCICVWMVKIISASSATIVTVKNEDQSLSILPYLVFEASGTPITSISFAPLNNYQYLVSSSFDKTLKFFDLLDTSMPFCSIKRGFALNDCKWAKDFCGSLISLHDGIIFKGSAFAKECGTEEFPAQNIADTFGSITCSAISDIIDLQAMADMTGTVSINFFYSSCDEIKQPSFDTYVLFETEVVSLNQDEKISFDSVLNSEVSTVLENVVDIVELVMDKFAKYCEYNSSYNLHNIVTSNTVKVKESMGLCYYEPELKDLLNSLLESVISISTSEINTENTPFVLDLKKKRLDRAIENEEISTVSLIDSASDHLKEKRYFAIEELLNTTLPIPKEQLVFVANEEKFEIFEQLRMSSSSLTDVATRICNSVIEDSFSEISTHAASFVDIECNILLQNCVDLICNSSHYWLDESKLQYLPEVHQSKSDCAVASKILVKLECNVMPLQHLESKSSAMQILTEPKPTDVHTSVKSDYSVVPPTAESESNVVQPTADFEIHAVQLLADSDSRVVDHYADSESFVVHTFAESETSGVHPSVKSECSATETETCGMHLSAETEPNDVHPSAMSESTVVLTPTESESTVVLPTAESDSTIGLPPAESESVGVQQLTESEPTVVLSPAESNSTVRLPPAELESTVALLPSDSNATTVEPPPVESESNMVQLPIESESTVVLSPTESNATVGLLPVVSKSALVLPPVKSESTLVLPPMESNSTVVLPPVVSKSTFVQPLAESDSTVVQAKAESESTVVQANVETESIVLQPPTESESIVVQHPTLSESTIVQTTAETESTAVRPQSVELEFTILQPSSHSQSIIFQPSALSQSIVYPFAKSDSTVPLPSAKSEPSTVQQAFEFEGIDVEQTVESNHNVAEQSLVLNQNIIHLSRESKRYNVPQIPVVSECNVVHQSAISEGNIVNPKSIKLSCHAALQLKPIVDSSDISNHGEELNLSDDSFSMISECSYSSDSCDSIPSFFSESVAPDTPSESPISIDDKDEFLSPVSSTSIENKVSLSEPPDENCSNQPSIENSVPRFESSVVVNNEEFKCNVMTISDLSSESELKSSISNGESDLNHTHASDPAQNFDSSSKPECFLEGEEKNDSVMLNCLSSNESDYMETVNEDSSDDSFHMMEVDTVEELASSDLFSKPQHLQSSRRLLENSIVSEGTAETYNSEKRTKELSLEESPISYASLISTCGLVFNDVNKISTCSEEKKESLAIGSNILSSVNAISWNPNYGCHFWLVTGGNAGVARLICVSELGSQENISLLDKESIM